MDKIDSPLFNIQVEGESFSFELAAPETIDEKLNENLNRLNNLDNEIDRLTDSTDKIDIWVSILSGLITGILDIFFVDELKLDPINGLYGEDNISGYETINKWVKKIASWTGYNGPDDLKKAIEYMENNYHIDCDNAYCQPEKWISSHKLHHLEDLCHHPTPVGFVAALCVSFLRIAIFSNKEGKTSIIKICKGDIQKTIVYWSAIVISGLLYWMSCALCKKYSKKELSELNAFQRILIKFGTSIPALSAIGNIAYKWALHLISDMAGSKTTAGAGMGIPGLFLSLMKEISVIPPFNKTKLPETVSNLYSRQRIDFRDELFPLAKHLGKQAIPVILNELIVSTFYFVSRLSREYKKGGWNDISWKNIKPFRNRTIVRMKTISSGVFLCVDTLGAAMETAIKGEGVDPSTFLLRMALKMNIVGVGKFVIDFSKDTSMGLRKIKMKSIRSKVMMEQVYLLGAKVYIRKNNLWEEAKDVDKALDCLCENANTAISIVSNNWKAVINDFSETNKDLLEYRNQDNGLNNMIDLYI